MNSIPLQFTLPHFLIIAYLASIINTRQTPVELATTFPIHRHSWPLSLETKAGEISYVSCIFSPKNISVIAITASDEGYFEIRNSDQRPPNIWPQITDGRVRVRRWIWHTLIYYSKLAFKRIRNKLLCYPPTFVSRLRKQLPRMMVMTNSGQS